MECAQAALSPDRGGFGQFAGMLDKLAKKTGRTKQELLREAVNTLLFEYRIFDLSKRQA